MFKKILIANRGEIAVRIIRACKELGIKTVAIFSEADEKSLHVTLADESVCVGPALATQSYLNVANVLSAAEILGCDAIHPGYGFLAESEKFAQLCEQCKITFIGPTPEMIHKMGNKDEARRSVKAAGVPVVPGSDGIVESYDEALREAKRIEFPVLIKATAGGGGKGMRVVYAEQELRESYEMARSEALAAFACADVYIEKFVFPVRHIEIQVMGDKKGNIVCFPERDCSLQRRNQKLIEESPSPFVWYRLRKKLMDAAHKAAASCRYENAGTIEFIVDEKGNYYFLEMNTRIQVEHPITEIVTGVDLVQEQIKVAAGEKLEMSTSDFYEPQTWAMEFRINAEDYERNFMPAPGTIDFCFFPGGPGVRVDTHVYSGYTIPRNYDSLLAKVIVFDKDRESVLKRSRRVLEEVIIRGVPTTRDFYLPLLDYHEFFQGKITTDSIGRIFDWLKEKKG